MIYSEKRIALGCNCIITLSFIETSNRLVERLFQQLWLMIFLFEQNYSRFLPSSQLTIFNTKAGTKQRISEELKALLLACQKYSHLSNGIFNPFILPALEKVGYDHSLLPGFEKDNYPDHPNAQLLSFTNLEVYSNMAFIPKGSAIDLGGLGKGFLADKLAKFILKYKEQINGFWISLGGDIHTYGTEDKNRPWKIYIEKDIFNKSLDLGYIESIKDKSLSIATSGVSYRGGVKNSNKWHHLIDPRTGLSAKTDLTSATVVSRLTIDCDVLASCLVIESNLNNFEQIKKKYRIKDALIQGRTSNKMKRENYYYKVIGKRININKND